MKQIYIASDPLDAQLICDQLNAAGLKAEMRGFYLLGAWGELPVNSYPSVWIFNDDEFDRAKKLVSEITSENTKSQLYRTAWTCPQCNESIDAQFTQCWNCGQQREN